jgi:uncharacterized protein (TIGR02246 family)
MEREDVERWVRGYERAWSSNDPNDIGELFTEDVTYRFHPWDEPLRGRDAIVATWIQNKDEPGDYRFRLREVAGVDGNVAFVTAETDYLTEPPRTYDNLWVIRLAPDGRCEDFTEWFMKRPSPPA